jgi:hypothetical protein
VDSVGDPAGTMTTPISSEQQIYIAAHKFASKHRGALEASEMCACFFCFRRFTSADIKKWVDVDQTALCPHCGLDSVLGNASVRIDDRFLRKMHQHHHGYRSK